MTLPQDQHKAGDVDRGILFLETLRRSAEMAQELFQANREMRLQVTSLEADLASKQARVAFLERETAELRKGLSRLAVSGDDERSNKFETLFEDQNVLAHLFITSDRLARVTSAEDAVTAAVEVLHNLVGAKQYAVWLTWPADDQPVCVACDGLAAGDLERHLPLARLAMTQRRIQQPEGAVRDQVPIALPLWLGKQVVGAVLVAELVPQRPRLERLHRDLLGLLGERLADALCFGTVSQEMPKQHDLWVAIRAKFVTGAP